MECDGRYKGALFIKKTMTREELIQFHEDFCKEMMETTKQKNNDYSSATDNAFGNLSAVERLGIATTEKGILVRMTDKISRINTFIQGHRYQVKDESVMDTLKDLANYTILLAAVIKDKQKEIRN